MSKVTNVGLHLTESASAVSDTAGEGQIWVKSDTSSQSGCSLYYTSDIGIENRVSGITLCSSFDTSSGASSYTLTGIPAGVKRICVSSKAVSLSGVDEPTIQLGTGGSPTTSGYLSGMGFISGNTGYTAQNTNGFVFFNDAASLVNDGVMVITLENASTNAWCYMSTCGAQSTTVAGFSFGSVALSGTMDNLRLISAAGSQTFDAGSMSVMFE